MTAPTGILAGKVALVTGGGRGIGRSIALDLAKAGCHVAVNYYVEPERAEQTVADVRALGVDAIAKADRERDAERDDREQQYVGHRQQ